MRVAMCCNVLQCVAECRNEYVSSHTDVAPQPVCIEGVGKCVLQCVAMFCNVLQCVAVCVLLVVLRIYLYLCVIQVSGNISRGVLQCVAVCCSVLQCAAICCSVLQCVAVCCSVCASRNAHSLHLPVCS